LALSPQYSRDKLVYAYLTSASDNRIVRFRLGGRVRTVLTGLQKAGIHNGRITYENDPYDFTVAVGVVNLFNKFYYVNVFDYQGLGYPQTDAQPAAPREWYLTVTKHF
jgi:outer membrane receptor protein involved in Fe transport